MRILIHSNAPWCGTGYGQQVAQLAPRMVEFGHEVAVHAIHGLNGQVMTWNGIPVYPRHADLYGSDIVAGHVKHFGADLVLTLCDIWVLVPEVFAEFNTASWFPVDCEPLSAKDEPWLRSTGAVPIAMSQHGRTMLEQAGFAGAQYVPHGIDTSVFRPKDQAECRRQIGVPEDAFVVGINAANKGGSPSRKAFPQQFEAFARLRRRHDDAFLLLHTCLNSPDGMNLAALAADFDLPQGSIRWSDQYSYRIGAISPESLATWYNACDLVSNATYGEGFGLPTVEAQACGVPIVVTDNSASRELMGSGWKVRGVKYWQPFHEAWWSAPDVDQLARTYEKAHDGEAAKRRGERAREFAVQYDADRVFTEYWKPTLELLEQTMT